MLQATYLKHKDTEKLNIKGWKNICHANSNQKSGSGYTYIGQNRLDKNCN